MKKLFLLFLFITIFFVSILNAQRQNLQFEQITNKSGRSLGFITGIVQDSLGFMWFSTRSGLFRYDGYDYKLFKKNPKDSTSLPYNDIANLYYDKSGILWLLHYDQYFPFKDEKLNFEYDTITKQHFDLQAKIIEDNHNNLWIGPSPRGLLKYNKTTKQSEYFIKSLAQYSPKALSYIDSFIVSKNASCKLIEMGNNVDTSDTFELKEDRDVLIISAGEADNSTLYDYGFISQNKDTLWQMSYKKLKYAGGSTKNKIQFDLIKLKKGKYKLNYKSDNSNSSEKWDGAAPDKINFYGIQLFCLSSSQKEYIKQNVIKDYYPENYISSNSIKDFLIDNTGSFCFLSDKGISKYVAEKNTFVNYNIDYCELFDCDFDSPYLVFFQDKDNDFWIGTNTGLIKYNHEKNIFRVFKNTKSKSVLTSNSIYTIYQDNLQKKYAGVGFARKIGMDEAVNRFNKINNSKGILVAFDADATCDDNFFTEIENHFAKNTKATACSIYYEHPISGTQFSESIYKTITQYELYLRYYNLSLRYADFPFAYHTVGSSFAVKADVYAKQGGMNRKKAGEDFYFLQKVIPLGNFTELHTTRIIPSPRPSDRVPFGTGATIKKFQDNNIIDLYTYNFQAFLDLKSFISLIDKLYKIEASTLVDFYNEIPENIKDFLIANKFELAINDINNNCSNIKNFKKRFFAWFNAFKVLKYMNFVHEHKLKKIKITDVSSQLLKMIKPDTHIPTDKKQLLEIFRSIEKNRRIE
jgi:hypothetical protein